MPARGEEKGGTGGGEKKGGRSRSEKKKMRDGVEHKPCFTRGKGERRRKESLAKKKKRDYHHGKNGNVIGMREKNYLPKKKRGRVPLPRSRGGRRDGR